MRISTWNLDHASNSSRNISMQIDRIREIAPDILILTETCDEVDLAPYGYFGCKTIKNGFGKYCSAIWSRTKLQTVETIDPLLSVAAVITTVLGDVLVYGTIIPYHGYRGKDQTSKAWEEHYKSITNLGIDLKRLARISSNELPLIVGGDFNQTRDGSVRTYGTTKGRMMLTEVLTDLEMECVTEEHFGNAGKLKVDPITAKTRNNIDHICVTRDRFNIESIGAWDHFTPNGDYLSDHNGVYVDLECPN